MSNIKFTASGNFYKKASKLIPTASQTFSKSAIQYSKGASPLLPNPPGVILFSLFIISLFGRFLLIFGVKELIKLIIKKRKIIFMF